MDRHTLEKVGKDKGLMDRPHGQHVFYRRAVAIGRKPDPLR